MTMSEPARSRAVLSTEDFKLLKEAVRFYLQNHEDSPESSKYSNLYHRLGSAGRG
jgi:glucokinase